jgi:hypothetical protein
MNRTMQSRGVVLIELLAVLIVLGAFSIVAGKLFYATLRVTVESHDAPRRDAARLEAVEQLRADIWGGLDMEIGEPRSLVVRYAGDRSVVWTIDGPEDQPRLQRTAMFRRQAEAEKAWALPGLPERFEGYGSGVRLHFSPVKGRRPAPVDLYSQLVQLAGGGR